MFDLTRREALQGLAAASLFAGSPKAQGAGSSVCFTSTVDLARLIRKKKLSARAHLCRERPAGRANVHKPGLGSGLLREFRPNLSSSGSWLARRQCRS
jgi:hypothetical protein